MGKTDYTTPKAYRPIALLNTIGKALESIIAEKIAFLTEAFKLLPESQMGARKGRSTDTALELLTEQVQTIWGQGNNKIATLLSTDVAGAFDTVSHERLIHNMRKRKIPIWITNWIESFLENRYTTLTINGRCTDSFRVRTGIPQGSPISPILYLFYNADLLDLCNRSSTKANGFGFVDDVNILTYSTSTEENCRTLETLHKKCEKWAARYGSTFAPAKYQLIHLSRNPKKFNMQATINIANNVVKPKTDIRVLGLQIDTALKWGPHIRKIQEKMTKQTLALTKLSTSTWGATFVRARQIYTAVVRPAITYGSTVWHTPSELRGSKTLEKKLSIIQNKCLRSIAGAYRATPIPVLEAETYISPLILHLDRLQRNARNRMRHFKQVRNSCKKIVEKLRGARGRKRTVTSTPGVLKSAWATSTLDPERRHIFLPPAFTPPWENITEEQADRQSQFIKQTKSQQRLFRDQENKDWQKQWTKYRQALNGSLTAAQQRPNIDKKQLKIHSSLTKAESSLATQIRTEKVGLADFLFKRRVPDITSPACPCGWPKQTPRHIITRCTLYNRDDLLPLLTQNYQNLLDNSKTLKVVTVWLMKTGILPQFNLAMEQLQE